MKKIIAFLIVCIVSTNAHCNQVSTYLGAHQNLDYYAYETSRKAENKANTAVFIAITAVAISTIGVLWSVKFSENNKGHVQIARF